MNQQKDTTETNPMPEWPTRHPGETQKNTGIVCIAVIVVPYLMLLMLLPLGMGMLVAIILNFLMPIILAVDVAVWMQRRDARYRPWLSPIAFILFASIASAIVTVPLSGITGDGCPVGYECANIGGIWLHFDYRTIVSFILLYLVAGAIGGAVGAIVRVLRNGMGRVTGI